MSEEIIILSVLKYQDKRSGLDATRIAFILSNERHKQSSLKFKGFTEIASYYNSDVFEKIPVEAIGVPVIANFKQVSSPSNPMRTTQIIESIEYNDDLYSLI